MSGEKVAPFEWTIFLPLFKRGRKITKNDFFESNSRRDDAN